MEVWPPLSLFSLLSCGGVGRREEGGIGPAVSMGTRGLGRKEEARQAIMGIP